MKSHDAASIICQALYCGGGGKKPPKNVFLRHTLIYGCPWAYYFAIVSNLLLRASWTYKLSSHLRRGLPELAQNTL
jgi:hypothetical protein